jgi:hypothetical protein
MASMHHALAASRHSAIRNVMSIMFGKKGTPPKTALSRGPNANGPKSVLNAVSSIVGIGESPSSAFAGLRWWTVWPMEWGKCGGLDGRWLAERSQTWVIKHLFLTKINKNNVCVCGGCESELLGLCDDDGGQVWMNEWMSE